MAVARNNSSSVHYVLLTGKPGIGKSTLVKKICAQLVQKQIYVRGFYTEEVRHSDRGQRIGFDVVTLNGNRAHLARVGVGAVKESCVGKYVVDVKSFEDIVLPLFKDHTSYGSVLVIDEIGKMEMLSDMFCREVKSIFTKPQTILATIPFGKIPFVKQLQSLPLSQTIQVDYTNRNSLLDIVLDSLLMSVRSE